MRYAGKGQISILAFIREWYSGATRLDELVTKVGPHRSGVAMAYIKRKHYAKYKETVGYKRFLTMPAKVTTPKDEEHFSKCGGRLLDAIGFMIKGPAGRCPICRDIQHRKTKDKNAKRTLVPTPDLPPNPGKLMTVKPRIAEKLNPLAKEYKPSKQLLSQMKLEQQLRDHEKYREIAKINQKLYGFNRPCFSV